ncbi:DegT/DnrJ/EryC1/StrS family aminotransferase [Actinokineospora diospyrosa]|uniref:dTDP-4-amino-4,6-dideoxygalactose transaminase n=1 Tax=Actinokineospora diospyrosa TaxID=103728 RepID=A0ABT1IN23_9PSEU|nr:DegT/DnrJ/EryC1/StrS family aminotransferase [Actinokineospora diospyrosa]MCP2273888.1 dTDP-4-amino-4,6-dideoxygalactose transaminase [Actinokineospora diospyrosa]
MRPAALGGAPAFDEQLPLIRPSLATDDDLLAGIGAVLDSGMITNGAEVRRFERLVAEFLGVPNVVAVSNATTGLLLLLRCLDLNGPVVVPSFTFIASGHAVLWNGLPVVFADSDPRTATIDPSSLPDNGFSAILATHTYGSPCAVDELSARAERAGAVLLFDAAHGFGARYPDGSQVGAKGLAEVFSLSPTKTLTTGEGGLITTADDDLARQLRVAREYGNPGNYDSVLLGLNGRMTEIAALLGNSALPRFPGWLEQRHSLVERYVKSLADVPGLSFQEIPAGAVSSYKDFTVRVGSDFGLTRDELAACLRAERISTRPYFDPPLHRQSVYADVPTGPLPGTEELSRTMITLPLSTHLAAAAVDRVCDTIARVHEHSAAIAQTLRRTE